MATISRSMFNELVEVLQPFFQNEDSRKRIVRSTFYDSTLPKMIDWGGSSGSFTPYLISTLLEYGQLDDQDALIILLQEVRKDAGLETQARLDKLITQLSIDKSNHVSDVSQSPEKDIDNYRFQLLTVITGFVALVASVIWFVITPSLEPAVSILLILVTVFASVFLSYKDRSSI